MNDFITWNTLATFAGCATATAVLTQFVKDLKPLKNVATQWVSYGLALILLFGATYFTGALTGSMVAIIPFNAAVVALAANGAYSALDRVTKSTTNSKATEPTNLADVKVTADADKTSETVPKTSESASKKVIG